jgi:hypothetical protein
MQAGSHILDECLGARGEEVTTSGVNVATFLVEEQHDRELIGGYLVRVPCLVKRVIGCEFLVLASLAKFLQHWMRSEPGLERG